MTNLGPKIEGDDYAVLTHALALDRADGWALEFGTGTGATTRLIAEHMPVISFDSFNGLPEDWRPDFPAGMFATDSIPTIENATIVVGLFQDTLPHFDWPDQVALIHFDADLYSSTFIALKYAGHLIRDDTIVVFDEYFGYDDAPLHEQLAWEDWAMEHNVIYEAIGHGREQVAFRVLGFGERVGGETK